MNPPVIIVIIVAVFFGLSFKILNQALPILEPNKSPNVEIKPPRSNKKIMKSQPDTISIFIYLINNIIDN